MSEHIAYVGLGSNVGDRGLHLSAAREAMSEFVSIKRVSSEYETEPVDFLDQPWFLNQVVMCACHIPPFELLERCLKVEAGRGRQRNVPKGPRPIDIDLLMYDEIVMDGEQNGVRLILPHPRLHLRRFVLIPLSEIAATVSHPVLGKSVQELLNAVDDASVVHRVEAAV